MAIGPIQVETFDGTRKPKLGDVVRDILEFGYKMWDGTEWIHIDESVFEKDPHFAKKLAMGVMKISDELLETKYPDLKVLREDTERRIAAIQEEYDTLRDKYKVFEILRRDGAQI